MSRALKRRATTPEDSKSIIIPGDCRDVLRTFKQPFDSVVCDPPYGLSFMGKGWDHEVPGPEYWRTIAWACKPGTWLVAMGGTRTHHRLMCAIEDAGWEIRDCLMWLYGSGFPKSLDVSKAIDKAVGVEREVVGAYASQLPGGNTFAQDAWSASHRDSDGVRGEITTPATPSVQYWDGWGTALKPAWEPIIMARKPIDGTVATNVLKHGTGAINIDGCRVGISKQVPGSSKKVSASTHTVSLPGHTGGIGNDPNIGRHPANLILDEEAGVLLDAQAGNRPGMSGGGQHKRDAQQGMFGAIDGNASHLRADNGGPSRFFYCPKASTSEREAGLDAFESTTSSDESKNRHPTVKPIELMRWLVRLVTPPGGRVLDPFCGSGSTGCAAVLEGRNFVGIEKDEEEGYVELAELRIEHWGKLAI